MRYSVNLRTIQESEVRLLAECLNELAHYHNVVSTNFQGHYPSKPYDEVLAKFCHQIKTGTAYIAVVQENDKIIGFCKCDIDVHSKQGKLDYLAVLQSHRGNGYGGMLIDWAMEFFSRKGIDRIEVKVISGNEAIRLYEKYGFKINAHILWRT